VAFEAGPRRRIEKSQPRDAVDQEASDIAATVRELALQDFIDDGDRIFQVADEIAEPTPYGRGTTARQALAAGRKMARSAPTLKR